jgi:hypothetical protein
VPSTPAQSLSQPEPPVVSVHPVNYSFKPRNPQIGGSHVGLFGNLFVEDLDGVLGAVGDRETSFLLELGRYLVEDHG